MIEGLLGRKLGMIQMFDKEGRLRGATVIEAGPCLITQIRTRERDGYEAVQIGFGTARKTNKPMRGHLGRQGDLRYLREFPVDDPSLHNVGDRLGAEMFHVGDHVDVTGVSKGRGFAGTVKRHGFHGGPKTHGQSDRHRAPGSIGSGNTPGRVFKGMKMSGHMGAERVTVENLEILDSNPARGTLLVAGSVPGARNGLLRIRFGRNTLEEARGRKPQAAEQETPAASEEEAVPPASEEQDTPDVQNEKPEATDQPEAAAEQEAESPADEKETS